MSEAPTAGLLAGVRVLDIGTLLAGPGAATLLGDHGAEVLKIERPDGGDTKRQFGPFAEGESLVFAVEDRNKKSLTLDLRSSEGRDVARKLIAESDVLIENFRPGTLEAWGLGWDALHALNPALVMLRVSGYGQSGPYRDRPGFGVVAEAMGGLRHLSGEPGRTPVRVGVSIGDSLSALHGVIGILLALRHREQNGGDGQMIDVALYESVFNVMESLLPEFSAFGAVRQPAGSSLPGIAPSNAYRCADGKYALPDVPVAVFLSAARTRPGWVRAADSTAAPAMPIPAVSPHSGDASATVSQQASPHIEPAALRVPEPRFCSVASLRAAAGAMA